MDYGRNLEWTVDLAVVVLGEVGDRSGLFKILSYDVPLNIS
jgi:hypothetical protein